MTFRRIFTTCVLFAGVVFGATSEFRDGRRPFFIIGHMANTIPEAEEFLRDGANALEVDIEFAENGTVLGTHHDLFPCECFRVCGKRTNIKKFLSHIRKITFNARSRYAGKMVLLFLDLKTSKVPAAYKLTAGRTLAQSLVKYLWNNVPQDRIMNVLLSIGYVNDQDVLKGAIKFLDQKKYAHFQRNIGFDVGMNARLRDIRRMYKKMAITHHRWQGDGLMNCFRLFVPQERLKRAIRERDKAGGYIDKVYYWTVDLKPNIAEAISYGIDGIITNKPENAYYVVMNQFPHELRLADRSDNPWQKIPRAKKKNKKSNELPYHPDKECDENARSNLGGALL